MRVLLSGYFGFGNTGDEMIFEVLKERFSLMGYDVLSLVKTRKNHNEYNRYNLIDILNAVKASGIVVSGGGGLIQDSTSSKSFLYYIFILLLGKVLRKKTVIFAQGIGPIKKAFNRWLLGKVVNSVDLITVRDSLSKDTLLKCNVKKEIYITADLAALFNKMKETILDNERYVIFSVVGIENEAIEKRLTQIIFSISDFTSLPVYILPLFPEKDTRISEKLSKYTNTKLLKGLSKENIAYVVSKAEFLVGSRYHSILLSAMFSVPFFALAYDPKVKSLSDEIGMKCYDLYTFSPEEFVNAFSEAFSNRNNLKEKISVKIQDLTRNAERNFELFKELFAP